MKRFLLSSEIPFRFSGRDVIAQAQSGTGKTATFSISVLQNIDENLPEVQALVMAPTRELAQQVESFIISLIIKYYQSFISVNSHVN